MKKAKEFIKTHVKKFIVGGVLMVCTLGIYGVYKLIKIKMEES